MITGRAHAGSIPLEKGNVSIDENGIYCIAPVCTFRSYQSLVGRFTQLQKYTQVDK